MFDYDGLNKRLSEKGMTKSALTESLKISSRTISKIARGEKLSERTLQKIADSLWQMELKISAQTSFLMKLQLLNIQIWMTILYLLRY